MKKVKMIMIGLMTVATLVSCKKDNPQPKNLESKVQRSVTHTIRIDFSGNLQSTAKFIKTADTTIYSINQANVEFDVEQGVDDYVLVEGVVSNQNVISTNSIIQADMYINNVLKCDNLLNTTTPRNNYNSFIFKSASYILD